MVIFGFKLEKSGKDFIKLTNERINNKTVIFKGEIKEYKDFYVFHITPLIFPFYYIGIFGLLSSLYLAGFGWWCFPTLFLSASYVFWDKHFYYFMLWIGLKKFGYKGKLKLLKTEDTIIGLL